ncbi:hypothetical protein [Alicyclobacillus sp. ALC3]|uniref:hypothetical protein n=1 Tax=Alicyclobacillus sp. ALC3 TaxID=2796143 RepID=UPI002379AB5D|nr:hypothetical protein [Alicyclobacillus sp. ALC3]WDL95527.1 hypothetical protein JC200_14135 [Alicyclobacillus sp. ALC3]
MQASHFIALYIQTISGSAGVYIGAQNIATGVSGHSKKNSAVGSLGTHSRFCRNLSLVYDPDTVDAPIDDRDTLIFVPYPPSVHRMP